MNGLEMCASHGKDVCGTFNQRTGQGLAAQIADIGPFFLANLDRVETWWLAANRVYTSGRNLDVFAVADQTAEETFRDRAPANITRTNKENAFHGVRRASTRNNNL